MTSVQLTIGLVLLLRELPMWAGALLAVGGIAAVVVGADLLVGAAIEIASAAGLSEAIIGLTLVAVGTSLPELVTSIMAAIRRHADVAFGNIVGSSIFNILGIAGFTAAVSPIPVPPEIAVLDVWIMIAAVLLLVLFAATGGGSSAGRRLSGSLRWLPARPAYADLPGMARARVGYQALATRTSQGPWRSRPWATLPSTA
jgi:hypothetical protein